MIHLVARLEEEVVANVAQIVEDSMKEVLINVIKEVEELGIPMMIAITEVLLLIAEIIDGTTGDEWIERIEQLARIAAITGVSNFYNTSKYLVILFHILLHMKLTLCYHVGNSILSQFQFSLNSMNPQLNLHHRTEKEML